MAQGMLHRAGVAIVLIATLLVPYGRCQSPAGAAGHDCCAHSTAPMSAVKANCCTVRTQPPAIPVERAALSPHDLAATAFFGACGEAAIKFPVAPKTPAPHHSPPPGASILRI